MSDLHTRLNAMLQPNGSMPSLADEITSAPQITPTKTSPAASATSTKTH